MGNLKNNVRIQIFILHIQGLSAAMSPFNPHVCPIGPDTPRCKLIQQVILWYILVIDSEELCNRFTSVWGITSVGMIYWFYLYIKLFDP